MAEIPHTIVAQEQLAEEVFRIKVRAPLIAAEHRPSQFVILQLHTEFGERIPLTIADADAERGTITLIFQTVGWTTHCLADLGVGEEIPNLVGPLGRPTEIRNFGTAVCVGGGIGVAPLHPIVQGMDAAGNHVITIIGARRKDLVILKSEMKALSEELIVCTDDGSYGRKALVTEPLKKVCSRTPAPNLAVAIGPPVMMKFCTETTRPFGVPTIVSLDTIMVDGTGMCGSCRVCVGGDTKFVCMDGPEFDGHQVDFDNMVARLGAYRRQERRAHDRYHQQEKKRPDPPSAPERKGVFASGIISILDGHWIALFFTGYRLLLPCPLV